MKMSAEPVKIDSRFELWEGGVHHEAVVAMRLLNSPSGL